MLPFDLAKALKNAGYPQPESIDCCPHQGFVSIYSDGTIPRPEEIGAETEFCYSPSLEELVDACREKGVTEIRLTIASDGCRAAAPGLPETAAEHSPEAALARLYLTLLEKNSA